MCREILSDVGRSHRLGISDVVDEVWIKNIGTVMDKIRTSAELEFVMGKWKSRSKAAVFGIQAILPDLVNVKHIKQSPTG